MDYLEGSLLQPIQTPRRRMDTHSREKFKEGRLTNSPKTHPANDVLDKLPKIMGNYGWGRKWLQKQSVMKSCLPLHGSTLVLVISNFPYWILEGRAYFWFIIAHCLAYNRCPRNASWMKGKAKYNKSTSEELMCMSKTWACGPEGSVDGRSTGTMAGGTPARPLTVEHPLNFGWFCW